ncbi:MAG: hypothetical protein NVS3B19_10980 [Ginsengibacter sp.]
MQHIVIIGNGISGITCARHIRKKSADRITIISSETEHFFSRTALMYVYMGHMKYEHIKPYEDFFWGKNKLDLVYDHVEKVVANEHVLKLSSGKQISYDILVIATGSVSRKYECPGQSLNGVVSMYNYQDLKEIESKSKGVQKAIIVGGGLIGVELAEMFHSKKIQVSMLVRDDHYWGSVLPKEDAEFVCNHIGRHGVQIIYNSQLKEIIGHEKVGGIITSKGEKLDCQIVGITTGVTPNISFLKDSGIDCDKGVLINEFFETNVSGIYAIGDCAQFAIPLKGRKAIEQIWYTGRMHGEVLAQTLTRKKTAYNPGPFFNSAKFFDLEYQTYGDVGASELEGEATFLWRDPKKEIALTFRYKKANREFVGVNCFGTRLRHEKFDQWLTQNESIDIVISNFSTALFDKEFSKNYTKELKASFQNEKFQIS